jgi:hypothetical protein
MSCFLSPQASLNSRILERDARLSEHMYKRWSEAYDERYDLDWQGGRFFGEGTAGVADLLAINYPVYCMLIRPRYYGAVSCLTLEGIARDSAGTAIAGVTVRAFTTADRVERGSVLNRADGGYVICTQEPGAHYITGQKDGSPDIQGVTNDALIPG